MLLCTTPLKRGSFFCIGCKRSATSNYCLNRTGSRERLAEDTLGAAKRGRVDMIGVFLCFKSVG